MEKEEKLQKIYDRAETLGIVIYPYIKEIIDRSSENALLPVSAIESLGKEDFKEYIDALYCLKNENACGYDGWSTAMDRLEKFGFKQVKVEEGHRVYVSLKYEA